MPKILITGASGFVGRHVVPALIEAGHAVRCAVTQEIHGLKAEQILIQPLELQSDWTSALQGVDIVIHLAARVHQMRETAADPSNLYHKINVLATEQLALQASEQGVKRFIFVSTIKVHGEFSHVREPLTEKSRPSPKDPYARSKLEAEERLQAVGKKTGMEIVILRPPLVYGPGVKANFLKMLQVIHKAWPLPFGEIYHRRSYLFVDNLVSALLLISVSAKAANQIYLVADDESWSISHLWGFLAKKMQRQSRLFGVPGLVCLSKLLRLPVLSTRLFASLEVSNQKLKQDLGWRPISAVSGLTKTAQWFKETYHEG